ncbi:MAG: hypothetical protein ACK5MH_05905 [Bacteroidales bacterium]
MKTKFLTLSAFTVVLIATLSASFFFSCSDKEDDNYNSSVERVHLSKSTSNPYYGYNPYDYVGYQHNVVLEKIKQKLIETYGTTNVEKETLYAVSIEELVEEGFYKNEMEAQLAIPFEFIDSIVEDRDNLYINSINNSNLSLEAKELINNLFSDILELSETTEGYTEYRDVIINVENNIMSSTLAENEKQVLLKSTSIARYSIYYWLRYYYIEANAKRPFWKYLAVGLADVAGGFAGGNVGTAISASALATTLVDWNKKPDTPPVQDTVTSK